MGCSFSLNVGRYRDVVSYKSFIGAEVTSLFDRRNFKKIEEPNSGESGGISIRYTYLQSIGDLKDRLDQLGFSLAATKEQFRLGIEDLKNRFLRQDDDDFSANLRDSYGFLEEYSFDLWLEKYNEFSASYERTGYGELDDFTDPALKFVGDPMNDDAQFGFPNTDPRFLLRAICELCQGTDVCVLDYTELVDGGYVDEDEDVCTSGEHPMLHTFSREARTIIITEGSIDTWVIRESFQLLYPHLLQYFSFLDFDVVNLPGGTSSLINHVKALASAGVVNNVIIVVDNDAAGVAAFNKLLGFSLPKNFLVMKYPDIDLAKSYPSIGPSEVLEKLNVNGRAGSIELYFGKDILSNPTDNSLFPVRWGGYLADAKEYQGEVVNKASLFSEFAKKVRSNAQNDRAHLLGSPDWLEMKTLIDAIIARSKRL